LEDIGISGGTAGILRCHRLKVEQAASSPHAPRFPVAWRWPDSRYNARLDFSPAWPRSFFAMYAIIEDSGTQIKVSEGDVIDIDLRTSASPGSRSAKGSKKADEGEAEVKSLTFDRVLMIGEEGGKPKIGTPYVKGASVTASVVEQIAGEKTRAVMYRRRKGYKRTTGHRQRYLRVKIDSIKG
jgi:large subunit ribosomal protein L21